MRRLHLAAHPIALASLFALSALGVSTGCSLLGTAAGVPEGLPHAGVGPYRDLTPAETNLSRAGVPVLLRGMASERPMLGGLHLFYAAASTRIEEPDAGVPDAGEPLDAGDLDAGDLDAGDLDAGDLDAGDLDAGDLDAGDQDAGVRDAGVRDAGPPVMPSDDVDWSAFDEGRRIFRSPPRENDWGFDGGTAVLTPEGGPAWEGGYVTEPWALETSDGALLYYAAAGGIGVARASSIDGTFSRVGTTPVLGPTGGEVPRCPSVVRTEGLGFAPEVDGGVPPPSLFEEAAFYMVYELASTIRYATSSDGLSFTERGVVDVPALEARDVRDGNPVDVGCPGVGIAEPSSGRRFLRIYYEARRDNGAILLGLFATSDGVTFDFHPTPVVADRDRRMPAPHIIDTRLSLLFHWRPAVSAGVSVGELRVGMAPGGAVLSGATR